LRAKGEKMKGYIMTTLDDPFDLFDDDPALDNLFDGENPFDAVEATTCALRKGTVALSQENVQGWLSHMNEKQLREVCARVRRFKHAKVWTYEEIERLVDVWVACHG
jgi:hypothetical protein